MVVWDAELKIVLFLFVFTGLRYVGNYQLMSILFGCC